MNARPRVGLFVTCLVDLMRPRIGFAAVKLLEQAGCDAEVPASQTLLRPAGVEFRRRPQCRGHRMPGGRCVRTFRLGGCAVRLLGRHDSPALSDVLAGDAAYAKRAQALAQRTHELVSFLVRVRGIDTVPATCRTSICYHDSCSSLREMRVKDEPRTLLASVDGLELHELKACEVCCGFGGLFSVKYPDISERMADDKIADAQNTGADVIASADLGCLLHLEGRIARRGLNIRTMHIAEILAGRDDDVS